MARQHHDRFSVDGKPDRSSYGYQAHLRSKGNDAHGDNVNNGIKDLIYKMYGEYLENLRKPYPGFEQTKQNDPSKI